MEDENIPSGQEAPAGSNGNEAPASTPPATAPDGNKKPDVSPDEQARRDAQSAKDRENADKGKDDQIDYLLAKEAERERDAFVQQVLSDKEKYPNVKSDDPLFKYATSQDEVTEIAAEIQNRFKDMQQEALRSVQTGDTSLTSEQIAEEEKKLEKEAAESGKSNFGAFLGLQGRRKN